MADEYNQYTIKYTSKGKDFVQNTLFPTGGRSATLGAVGAAIGLGLSFAVPGVGAIIGAGAGFVLGGPISQITYSAVFNARNLSKKHFSKVKLSDEDTVANGLTHDDDSKRNILAVKHIAEACDKRARDYIAVLNSTSGAKKYSIQDENGQVIQVSERKLKKMIKENENVARHALDYMMDIAVEQSNRYRAIDAESIRVVNKVTAMEFCMYMLQTIGQTVNNLVENRRTLGEVNPYKGTILRALQDKALIATKRGRLETLPSKSITHVEPSFNERINLNSNNEEMLTLYNELYETEIRATLQREQEERNAEEERISADKKKQIEAIEAYIRALVNGEKIRQARVKLDIDVLNSIENATLIRMAQLIIGQLQGTHREQLQQAIDELNTETQKARKNPNMLATCRINLSRLIIDSVKVIERASYNKGAQSRQAEIDKLLAQLEGIECENDSLKASIRIYGKWYLEYKRRYLTGKANLEEAQEQWKKLKDAFDKSSDKNAELLGIIQALKPQLATAEREMNNARAAVNKYRSMLTGTIDGLQGILRDLSSDVGLSKEEKCSVIEMVRSEIYNLKTRNKTEVEQLKQSLEKAENGLVARDTQIESLKIQIGELQTEFKQLQDDYNDLVGENGDLWFQIDNERVNVNSKIQELKDKLNQERFNEDEIKSLTSDIKSLRTQLQQARSQNNQLQQENEALMQAKNGLNKILRDKNTSLDKLQKRIKELQNAGEKDKKEILALQEKVDELETLRGKIEDTVSQFSEARVELIVSQYNAFEKAYNDTNVKSDEIEEALKKMREAIEKSGNLSAITDGADLLKRIGIIYGETCANLVEGTDMMDILLKAWRSQTSNVTARAENAEQKATDLGRELVAETDARKKAENNATYFMVKALREWDRAEQAVAGSEEMYEQFQAVVGKLQSEIESLRSELAETDSARMEAEKKAGILTDTYIHSRDEMNLGKAKKGVERNLANLREAIKKVENTCGDMIKSGENLQGEDRAELLKLATRLMLDVQSLGYEDTTYYQEGTDASGRRERTCLTDDQIETATKELTAWNSEAKKLIKKINQATSGLSK